MQETSSPSTPGLAAIEGVRAGPHGAQISQHPPTAHQDFISSICFHLLQGGNDNNNNNNNINNNNHNN